MHVTIFQYISVVICQFFAFTLYIYIYMFYAGFLSIEMQRFAADQLRLVYAYKCVHIGFIVLLMKWQICATNCARCGYLSTFLCCLTYLICHPWLVFGRTRHKLCGNHAYFSRQLIWGTSGTDYRKPSVLEIHGPEITPLTVYRADGIRSVRIFKNEIRNWDKRIVPKFIHILYLRNTKNLKLSHREKIK